MGRDSEIRPPIPRIRNLGEAVAPDTRCSLPGKERAGGEPDDLSVVLPRPETCPLLPRIQKEARSSRTAAVEVSCKEGFAALPRTLIRLARSAFNPTKTTGKVCIHAAQKKPAWLSTARGGCGAEPGRFVSDSHQAEEAWGTQSKGVSLTCSP
jgi:hypothetical protein